MKLEPVLEPFVCLEGEKKDTDDDVVVVTGHKRAANPALIFKGEMYSETCNLIFS